MGMPETDVLKKLYPTEAQLLDSKMYVHVFCNTLDQLMNYV